AGTLHAPGALAEDCGSVAACRARPRPRFPISLRRNDGARQQHQQHLPILTKAPFTVYCLCTVNSDPTVTNAGQIRIDLDSAATVNRQIVDQLRTLLVEGVVAPDDTLPSVRRMAIDMGVPFNTVAEEHRTLAEE